MGGPSLEQGRTPQIDGLVEGEKTGASGRIFDRLARQ
jgi:hypothetical protein